MRKLGRGILALSLLMPMAAMVVPTVAYADLMTADIQTPVVESFLDPPPALAPAVAIALVGHAKDAFLQSPGWECLQPSWNPAAPVAAGTRVITLSPRLWTREGEGQYGGELELAFAPPGGRREAATAQLPREVAEIAFETELGFEPFEDEGAHPFFANVASWLWEALLDLRDRGVKPCEFTVKFKGQLRDPIEPGERFEITRSWEGEGHFALDERGSFGGALLTRVQATARNITGGCTLSGSGDAVFAITGDYDDRDGMLRISELRRIADPAITLRGMCAINEGRAMPISMMEPPPRPFLAPSRTVSLPLANGAHLNLVSEGQASIDLEYGRDASGG
jgi:hypothetical protein